MSISDMDLNVEVYKSEDEYIFLTVRGPAQGLVQFPDFATLMAFLIDCQVLLGNFEGMDTSNCSMIPETILKAFEED